MELYPTEDNPVPDGATVAPVVAADGVKLRAASWAPTAEKAVGTVFLLQGRAEMIEKYFETISDLRTRGFHVVTFDWRGQGGSQRLLKDPRKGHVRDFDDYEEDLRAVIAAHLDRPKPWFGLSHSMGGCIALSAAHRRAVPFERLVCIAPMTGVHGIENPRGVLWLARVLRAIGLGGRYIPGGGATSIMTKPFEGNPLSSDPVRYARNARIASEHAHLAIGEPTISWTRAAFDRMSDFTRLRYPLEILTPVLVLVAGDERVVSSPMTEAFASRLKAGSAIAIPGARHEMLMERDSLRAQVFAAIDAFIPGSAAPERLAPPAATKK